MPVEIEPSLGRKYQRPINEILAEAGICTCQYSLL